MRRQSRQIIGVSDHNGWAVLGTVAGNGTLLDRRRVVLVDADLPSMPHHHEGQTLPLEQALDLVEKVRRSADRHAKLALDAVAIAERVTGQTFKVQKVPIAALRVVRTVLQPFNPILASLLAMGIGSERGEGTDMAPLHQEFGIQPTTFEQYVRLQTAGGPN